MMMLKRFLALVHARNLEFVRDTGAMVWNFAFPFLVVVGFAYAFSGSSQDLFKVGLVGFRVADPVLQTAQAGIHDFTQTKYIQFVTYGVSDDVPTPANIGQGAVAERPEFKAALDDALAKLRRHGLDLVLAPPDSLGGPFRYWLNESSPKGYLVERILHGAGTPEFAGAGAHNPFGIWLVRKTVDGKEIRYVDWLISGLLAINMCFSALFGVGYTIVRYRKTGVLRRLKATPIHAIEFLAAQVVSRLFVLVIVTTIVYTGSNLLVHFQMNGSYLSLFIVLLFGAICLTSLGLLVAARISSEEFAGGLLNLITWPMMFLSGVWFSLEGAHPWVKRAAQIFPLTHVIDGARAIMTEGATLAQVSVHLWVLAAMTAVFLAVGSFGFRWE